MVYHEKQKAEIALHKYTHIGKSTDQFIFRTDWSCHIPKQSISRHCNDILQGTLIGHFCVYFTKDQRGKQQNSQKSICNAIRGGPAHLSVCQTQGPPLIHTVQRLNGAHSIELHFLQFKNFCQLTRCLPRASLRHSTSRVRRPALWTHFQHHLSLKLPRIQKFQFKLIYSALKLKL